MSNTKLNCCICGKELGLGNRVSSDGVLWRCEDCARKQREEYDNKDKTIADLEAKLAEKTLTIEQINKAFMENRSLWKGKYERANQDKISFAVEQLSQFKSELVNKVSPVNLSYTEYVQEVFNKVDNQIKELKREIK